MREIDLVWGQPKMQNDEMEETEAAQKPSSEKVRNPRDTGAKTDNVSLHCSVSSSTTRQELKSLFFSYKVKSIKIFKAKNKSAEFYALVVVPNMAMALHAIKTFEGTNQASIIGYDRPLMLSLHRSRTENKKRRFHNMKSKSSM